MTCYWCTNLMRTISVTNTLLFCVSDLYWIDGAVSLEKFLEMKHFQVSREFNDYHVTHCIPHIRKSIISLVWEKFLERTC